MQEKSLISVIVPVYNVEPYLRQCLDSIVNQSYTNLQIIVVDDGSTDGSQTICNEYAQKDKRITFLVHKHEGVSATLNSALSVAEGNCIGMVDSDDVIHPQMYEILHEHLLKEQADIVACKWTSENSFSQINLSPLVSTLHDAITDFDTILSEAGVYRWNKLYKKEVFTDFKYPEGHVFEDEFIHRIFFRFPKVLLIDLPLYFYRIREGSIMQDFDESRIYDNFFVFDDRIQFIRQNKWKEIYDSTASTYCMRAIWMWKKLRENKVPNKKAQKFCLQKARAFLAQNPNAIVPKRYVLWAKSPVLYQLYMKLKYLLRKK